MAEATQCEKSLTGFIDDLDERVARLEDRAADGEVAMHNEKLQRRQDREELMQRIGQRKGETAGLLDRVNRERDVLNLTIAVVLVHLTWHAVAKAVDWWRWR